MTCTRRVRRVHWQRAKEQPVQDREDRGVGADAEGKRQDDRDRESRTLDERAAGVAQVLPEVVQPGERPDLPVDLPGLRDAAEAAQGRLTRGLGRQSLSDVLLRRFRQMARDLVVEVAVHLPRSDEGPQPRQKDPQARHDGSSEILKKRSTMPAARCHWASSCWSCLRPARVSV